MMIKYNVFANEDSIYHNNQKYSFFRFLKNASLDNRKKRNNKVFFFKF